MVLLSETDSNLSTQPVRTGHNNEDIDWQATKSLGESFHYLLEQKLLSDVDFIVGSDVASDTEKISAHKLVLSTRSSVFFAMFSDKWSADGNNNEVKVPDVEPAAFKVMLQFLYSDNVALTLDIVSPVIYAAKKYSIVALENKCSDYLSDNLCPENAFNVLIQARLFHMDKLVSDCLDIIAKNTDTALNSEDFLDIDVETLGLVLERSDLRIEEILLFDAVNRWAEEACVKNNHPVSPKQKRLLLKDALSFLRFPVMEPRDFSSKVVTSGLLSKTEIISVLLHFSSESNAKCDIFNTEPRRTWAVAHRFQHEVTGGCFGSPNPTSYHKIQFHSNRAINLIGFGLYGTPDVTYQVKTQVTNSYYGLNSQTNYRTHYCSDKIFRVFFPQPIKIQPNTNNQYPYLLQVLIQGYYSTYGCSGKSTITKPAIINNTKENVIITFLSSENVPNEGKRGHMTDVNSGQIPELLFDP
ncbi:unnamed protein product [Bemisia tabaci]|uniref:BTB domain-containing protein n=2 Tax=Bemisia tabaci TaxID=7038 RepID=A0A9P0AKZ2_BEMTA|nr:unnamed protein product [Bemisia tabaci]